MSAKNTVHGMKIAGDVAHIAINFVNGMQSVIVQNLSRDIKLWMSVLFKNQVTNGVSYNVSLE